MKKILFFICAAFALVTVSVQVKAQAVAFAKTATNTTGAVLTGTIDTSTVTVSNPYSVHGIQFVFTKTSGTAAATSILQASINGTTYVNTDTITFGNASASSIIVKTNPVYLKYRILTTGAGTSMVATFTAAIIGRKLF